MIEVIEEKDFCKIQELIRKFPETSVNFTDDGQVPYNNFRQIFTISDNQEMIGYLILDIIYERMELIQITILNEKRKQGYGSKLLEFMIEEAKQRNLENITLEVRKDNIAAIHLYEKYQFRQVAIRQKYYHGIDGILMERKMM